MELPTLEEIEAAAEIVRAHCPPTPQYPWPLLAARVGCEVWVKHENHTPIGAFKLRGGLYLLERLRAAGRLPPGIVSATRGNHGQSLALAGRIQGLPVTIVVPHGNSLEKNRAMRAFGAELIEAGEDFEAARAVAAALAAERGLMMVPPFTRELVCGVATYALEFLRGAPPLDVIYVAIGMGSGICGLVAVRDALRLPTEIVGVVAASAPAYALSFAAGEVRETGPVTTLADGVACRAPSADALALIRRGVARVVQVSEDGIAEAMRAFYTDTHNLAEGAGAIALGGLLAERDRQRGRRVGVVLSGGNVDAALMVQLLAEAKPAT